MRWVDGVWCRDRRCEKVCRLVVVCRELLRLRVDCLAVLEEILFLYKRISDDLESGKIRIAMFRDVLMYVEGLFDVGHCMRFVYRNRKRFSDVGGRCLDRFGFVCNASELPAG